MRKYLVLAVLSVFTLIGGTALAAGLLVKQQTDYYYDGPTNDESQFFNPLNWRDDVDPDDCTGSADVPCHLSADSEMDLAIKLTDYDEDVQELISDAGKRSY